MSEIYIVIKNFTSRLSDELTLKIGDKIEVLSDDSEYNDGWYFGKNLLSGEVGLYPASFTTKFDADVKPTIMRSRSRLNKANVLPNMTINSSEKSVENVSTEKLSPVLDKNGTDKFSPILNKNNTTDSFEKSTTHTNQTTNSAVGSNVLHWTPEEVSTYLKSQDIEESTANLFIKHQINGEILLELDLAHLKEELEIASFGTRFKINKLIQELKTKLMQENDISSTSNKSNESPYTETTTTTTLMPSADFKKPTEEEFFKRTSSVYDNRASVNGHKRHSSLFSFLNESNLNEPFNDTTLSSPPKINASADQYLDIDNTELSPRKRVEVRSQSESAAITNLSNQRPGASRLKSLRTTSTQNFKNFTGSRKSKTSAFQEGIRDITPDEAIKSANYSGYMSKRSSNTLAWRTRYFTLHGTRLSYFTSLKDKREKGLIDITAHKVIPINIEEAEKSDKYAAIYASTTFAGNFCFKLVPPAPGFKKGLTFTQPKTHYFAVESEQEMRGWVKALMTATIEFDDSVPVVSSCSTPTVSLLKAQELLAKAREENKLKDEELRSKGYLRDQEEFITNEVPKLTIDTKKLSSPKTPQLTKSTSQNGFASPYLLASGLLSPRSGNQSSPNDSGSGYFERSNSQPPSRQNSQMLSYTSDGSESHTFYMNKKK
ncbi:unnamed protein product [Candida verbasci]|uniref:Protein BOI2 n=1 Tax=Candida verbasci TaxID=1227364 RepID=A0A9W4TSB8_9ASCO|nr:unnamed protein product [Candida verbasci]